MDHRARGGAGGSIRFHSHTTPQNPPCQNATPSLVHLVNPLHRHYPPSLAVDSERRFSYNLLMDAALAEDWLTGLDEYESVGESRAIDPVDVDEDEDEESPPAPTAADRRQIFDAQRQVMPGVSAGALIEAMEKPEIFAELARGDLYVQMHHMRIAASDPRFTPNQRMEYAKFLARMGKVDAPESADGLPSTVPIINITFPNAGRSVRIGAAEKDITPAEVSDG